MKIKFLFNAALGITTEVAYSLLMMLAAFVICLILAF